MRLTRAVQRTAPCVTSHASCRRLSLTVHVSRRTPQSLTSGVSRRSRIVRTTLLFLLFLGLAACRPAASSPIYDHLSSDPKVLHIEFPAGNGLQTIWSLHPTDAPSSDFESERGQTVTRIAGSITEQTPAAYRVTFLRTVTVSGAAGTPQQEIVAFPFGRVTRARVFGAFDISGFYGNPHKRP